MNKKQDYYTVLGVSRDVGEAELKSAYRNLVKQYHPDINRDNPDAGTKMKELNDAYFVLSNPQKRAEYDCTVYTSPGQSRTRTDNRASSDRFDSSSDVNFDDLLGDVFGSSYADYIRYSKRKDETVRDQSKGKIPDTETVGSICKRCNGSGMERTIIQSGFGRTTRTCECSLCHGKGKI